MPFIRIQNVFFTVVLFLLFLSSNAQLRFTRDSLAEIENSEDYKKNIVQLTNALRNYHFNDEELRLDIIQALLQKYRNENQFDKAIQFCQDELLAARKSNNQLAEATMYQQLGKIHYYLKMPDKVKENCLACIKIAEKNKYYELLKRSYHNLGVIEIEIGNTDEALKYFLISIENGEKVPQTKKSNIARNYRLLATTYDAMQKYKAADSMYNKALSIYNHFNDSLGMIEVLTFKARMECARKNYKEAHRFAKSSIDLALIVDNDEYTQAALSVLQQIFEAERKFEDANKIMRQILEIEAHKNQKILNKELATAETKFKIKEIENKESLKVAEANQKTQLYIFIAGLLLVTSLGIVSFMYQRRISKREKTHLQQLFQTQEQERSRISKDLHDNMGAYATSLLAQIDTISALPNASPALKELRTDAENIMATLRETIWILKSGNLSLFQFRDLIRQYAEKQLNINAGIAIQFKDQISEETTLSPATSLNLYRIFQEVVQNVIKHAKANSVSIQISFSNRVLACLVTDNGIGFDTQNQSDTSGLENMRYRAREIGFEIQLNSSSSGTVVHLVGKV